MKMLVLVLVTLCSMSIYAQQTHIMQFSYDAAGNRISSERIVQIMKPPSGQATKASIQEPISASAIVASFEVSVSPNPTSGIVNIHFSHHKQGAFFMLMLFDLQGRVVDEVQNISSTTTLDLRGKTDGTYILRIKSGNEFADWKIIKQE